MELLVAEFLDAVVARDLTYPDVTISRFTESGRVERITFNYCPRWDDDYEQVFLLSIVEPCNVCPAAFEWYTPYTHDEMLERFVALMRDDGWHLGRLVAAAVR